MQFDMRELGLAERYKLMNSTITPRPIAWVTTRSKTGLVNAAPYSFFNACGVEPPLVVLGLLKDFRTRERKDTATNIVETGEFVVNLVCEKDAETMNLSVSTRRATSARSTTQASETAPSIVVAPPRIATSPVNLECRRLEALGNRCAPDCRDR
ncbi:MAG: flavin reductase family protein [Novosphingobium sp.]